MVSLANRQNCSPGRSPGRREEDMSPQVSSQRMKMGLRGCGGVGIAACTQIEGRQASPEISGAVGRVHRAVGGGCVSSAKEPRVGRQGCCSRPRISSCYVGRGLGHRCAGLGIVQVVGCGKQPGRRTARCASHEPEVDPLRMLLHTYDFPFFSFIRFLSP